MNTRILIWETDVVWAEELKKMLDSAGMDCQEVDFMEEYKRLSYSSRYAACILGWGCLDIPSGTIYKKPRGQRMLSAHRFLQRLPVR